MFAVALGHCEDIDSDDAIADVLATCDKQLNGLAPQGGILIASEEHDFQILNDRIREHYPELEFIGCSTEGEISSVAGFTQDSVVLMLFHSDRIRFKAGLGVNAADEPAEAARAAVTAAMEGADELPALCVMLPEVWGVNIHALLQAAEESFSGYVPTVGGSSVIGNHIGPSIQCCNGKVVSSGVPVLLFFGPLKFSHTDHHGWTPMGEKHRVTESDGNFVTRIDGRPATDLYVKYFGDSGVRYPIAVYPDDGEKYYLSAAFDVMEDGRVFYNNHIPEQSWIQFGVGSPEEMISAVGTGVREALSRYPGVQPDAGIVISCAGRKFTLGVRIREEIQQLRQALGDEIPVIGFYSGGELCPLDLDQRTESHAMTFVTILIGES